jgi:hypothetical protein
MPKIKQDHWELTYTWSASSGLRLGVVEYRGQRVLHSAAVPFIFVNYQGGPWGPYTDELRSLANEVTHRDIVRGFDLQVTYDLYGPDYRYDHVWRFHRDGQFGTFIVIHGPGEELLGRHTYQVPFRFDLDISGAEGDTFQRWQGYWADVSTEGQQRPAYPHSPEYDWQIIDKATNRRAMIRAHRGDDAECWPQHYRDSERWGSWGGVQATPPGSAGSVPALYADGQTVVNTDIVVWYLAHVSSRDLMATCGPSFQLAGFGEDHDDGAEEHHNHDHDHNH